MLLEQKTTDFWNSSHRQHRFREVAVHRQQSERSHQLWDLWLQI